MSDNRRDQLIEFVEREFIGPDPIDWTNKFPFNKFDKLNGNLLVQIPLTGLV